LVRSCFGSPPRPQPWNKGKLIGAKPPLRASHVWWIRTKLLLERRTRHLALFNLAIDSKLRGCDVVAVRVEDVAPNGYTLDRAYGPNHACRRCNLLYGMKSAESGQFRNFTTARRQKIEPRVEYTLKQRRPGPQGKREIIKLMLLSRTPSLVLYLIRNVI
jgi:hypothetical protein